MAEIDAEHIETWSGLSGRIDEYFTHYKDYIFRGQADARWPLESTLARALRNSYPGDKYKLSTWSATNQQ